MSRFLSARKAVDDARFEHEGREGVSLAALEDRLSRLHAEADQALSFAEVNPAPPLDPFANLEALLAAAMDAAIADSVRRDRRQEAVQDGFEELPGISDHAA
jgi:hypothetical protein